MTVETQYAHRVFAFRHGSGHAAKAARAGERWSRREDGCIWMRCWCGALGWGGSGVVAEGGESAFWQNGDSPLVAAAVEGGAGQEVGDWEVGGWFLWDSPGRRGVDWDGAGAREEIWDLGLASEDFRYRIGEEVRTCIH